MTESGKHARKALYGLDPMEKMLSVKGTRMLLLYIYEHPGCTKKDARDWLFDGRRRDSAFRALIEYGALADGDGKELRLTEKGAFMAEIFLAMRTAEEKGEFPLPENVRVPGSRKRCCRGSAGRLGPDRDRGGAADAGSSALSRQRPSRGGQRSGSGQAERSVSRHHR